MNDICEEDHNISLELVENGINSKKSSNVFGNIPIFSTEEFSIPSDEKISFLGMSNDSQLSLIINIVCSAIGGSCFNFPFILEKLGLPLTLIIFILVMLSIYYTIDFFRSLIVDTKFFSIALMIEKIIGKNWKKVYAISSLVFFISIEINYISEIFTIVS